MMALVPNFLLSPEFCFPGIVGEDGEEKGAGEGELKEQSVNGGPHKIEFPVNEEIGNFPSEYGIDPFSMLWLKFSSLSLGRLKSGIEPVNELNWSLNIVSRSKFLIVGGMLPLKKLKDKSNTLSWAEREVGISPENLLC